MSARIARERELAAEERKRWELLALRRLSDVGRSGAELARSIELPGGAIGMGAILRRLEDQGLAHDDQTGRWFAGPGPWRAHKLTEQRPPRAPDLGVIRDRVLEDLEQHPGSTLGQIAIRLDLLASKVSTALQQLRQAHAARCHSLRWSATTPPDPVVASYEDDVTEEVPSAARCDLCRRVHADLDCGAAT